MERTGVQSDSRKSVLVVGGGVAGMSAACALAEAGLRVRLVERRAYLGGRASSYLHPGVNEVIDNCQHALIGCYTNLLCFYRRIGAEDQVHWTQTMTMIEPGGHRSRLGPLPLPAPLHGLPRLLSAHAFNFADKLSLARAFSALMRPVPQNSTESLGAWLRSHGQSEGALKRFWWLVVASALNSDLDSIALPYAAKVIRELFMNSVEAGAMGVSKVPLSELYAGVDELLQRSGGSVLMNATVESAAWDSARSQWTVATRTGSEQGDFLVLALPFEAMAKMIPLLPPAAGVEQLARQTTKLEHWPICSVHLWFDRPITELEHAVLLDREIHWMYNKGLVQTGRSQKSSYVELVVSASRAFAALPREQAIEQAVGELAEFFPQVREAKLEKAALTKDVRATFAASPGVDAIRPSAVAPWPHCFLAGDWTATGWPSTMESAARSGHLAAEALCRTIGAPRRFLEPDLQPKGLMRWVKQSL